MTRRSKPRQRSKPRKAKSGGKRKSRKQNKPSKKRSLTKRALVGAGLIGAGLLAKKLRQPVNNKLDVYEENILVSGTGTGTGGTNVPFNDITKDNSEFVVRSTDETVKQKSSDPLYSTYRVEILKGGGPFENVVNSTKLPKGQGISSLPPITNKSSLPTYFIINTQLPPLDGVYFSVVVYYQIKQHTIEAALNPTLDTGIAPAIGLLTKFTSDNEHGGSDYKDRLKAFATVVDTGSLDIGDGGQWVIKKFKLDKQIGTILNKTVKHYRNAKYYEIDIHITEFDIPPLLSQLISMKKLTEYYDKADNFKLNMGFLLEGGRSKKHEKERTHEEGVVELPEVLLGGTQFSGFKFLDSAVDTESRIVGHPDVIAKIDSQLINLETMQLGNKYAGHVYNVLDLVKTMDIHNKVSEKLNKVIIPKDPRPPKSDANQIFLYSRWFYYSRLHNKEFKLSSRYINYSAGPSQYIAKGTCFTNERIFNMYQVTNGSTTTYRFGLGIRNAFGSDVDFTDMLVSKLKTFSVWWRKLFNSHKKLVVVCLLSPCNTTVCKTVKNGAKLLPKEAYMGLTESNILEVENNRFSELGDIFLNVPLSKSTNVIPLFQGGVKSLVNSEFEQLIDVSTPEKTFKTIVDIATLYTSKYQDSRALCIHCRSGKDRTSIYDSVTQATIYYLRTTGSKTIDYDLIKGYAKYFLMFSYVITFYSSGIPGLKLTNIPVAKYLLNPDEYQFFLGNSRLSSS